MSTDRLTLQEVVSKLGDAHLHYSQLATEYKEKQQQERFKRIAIVAKSLRENIKTRGNSFGLDLERAIEDAQQKIRAKQGKHTNQSKSKGASRYGIFDYIRDIERYTKIKYIPAPQVREYPQCPLM